MSLDCLRDGHNQTMGLNLNKLKTMSLEGKPERQYKMVSRTIDLDRSSKANLQICTQRRDQGRSSLTITDKPIEM